MRTFLTSLLTLLVAAPAMALTSRGMQRVESIPQEAVWAAGHGGQGIARPSAVSRVKVPFDSRTWSERRQAPLGLARTLWGRGITVHAGTVANEAQALQTTRQFFAQHTELLPSDYSIDDFVVVANSLDRDGVRIVRLAQTQDKVVITGASIWVAYKFDRLVMLGLGALPLAKIDTTASIDEKQAVGVVRRWLADRGIGVQRARGERVIFVSIRDQQLHPLLAYRLNLRSSLGRATAYVDAHKGELLALRDDRQFTSLKLQRHARNIASEVVDSNAPFVGLGGVAEGFGDGSGSFATTSTGALTASLTGRYIRMNNIAGPELGGHFDDVSNSSQLVWSFPEDEPGQAQMDAYAFANEIRVHDKAYTDVAWLDEPLRVNVNYNESCNAWFDGELTFLKAGESQGMRCNNTATVADIVYHEFGHGLHMALAENGAGGNNAALSEGFADFNSASLTDDHALAPYMAVGGAPLRDLAPDRAWPQDEGYEPHETGLIVGGAFWDLRERLMASLGDAAGAQRAMQIFVTTMRLATTIPSVYEAAMLGDDDNGNLDDGTPNTCAIDQAFAPHGLSDVETSLLRIHHQQPQSLAADEPVSIEAEIAVSHPECSGARIGDARVVYSSDAGETWQNAALQDQGQGGFVATLPGFGSGTQLRYRIEVKEQDSGTTLKRPSNAAEPFYRVYVGSLRRIVCDNFEGEELGWSHRLLAGQAVEGADDWQLATPSGVGGDPQSAYSGDYAWGNDLGLEDNWNGQYQASKKTSLDSPSFDLGGAGQVRLQFRRWLQVEDGLYDRARLIVNGTEIWANAALDGNTHHLDREWVLFDADVSAAVAGSGEARVRFELESDQGLEFGGWNVDDVCLYEMVSGSVDAGVDAPTADPSADAADGARHLAGCGCRGTAPSSATTGLGLLLMLGLLIRRRSLR